jgi:hypothetical protein
VVLPPPVDAGSAPTFTQVYAIITATCAPCHVGGGSGGLAMGSQGAAYTNLLAGRVMPGNSAMSRLFCKISGTDCGSRMPQGRAPLTPMQIATIGAWITAGAPNN